ncbi:snRNA-activating protein complex subunit 4 isoform X1 [Bos javanicus]|uniref:snRNA-activating protein complex subunit 4 isoform X1 n=1 Tax=Bos javanicus TaxID=9906 RepID=UPI002AA7323C|nr:snRNA-activating protein complex subunit 4 isoform X1 [Bos javanicus]XP_061290039.1 snRNA-activating protein complex subunit 4 isoform X1 [Bos javanicus]XP_061290040.1 snRNA-activating protein complex subunit 4 isoform X1 [Bos javanicus]XP_061290041.1 snRNA-activating protein complex subunit 4 isoform X1 [Bos javanicus]
MDVDAERERISREIQQLERILDPCCSSVSMDVSESSLNSDSDADSLPDEDLDSDAAGPLLSEEERWGEASNDEDDPKEKALPEDPETCLQLNMVYQEVVREKLAEVSLLLAQNREQQEEVMGDLVGVKGPKVKDDRNPPPNLYLGHFMKPYFRDRVTGVGPPANEDTREKAAQGIKAFTELLVTKWKTWEKVLLRKSVVSDRLQRLLQPKLLKLEYLQQKQSRATSELEKQILEKQAREAEKEVQDINQLPEEALLGDRLDSHDWDKISNVNFEGGRSTEEIRKFWQNHEHPSINKQEWSEQEVAQLKAVAAKHGHLDWQSIAEELGTHRSAFQCLQRYQQHNPALKRREWTEEEDRMLTRLVQAMRVGSHIPYRRIVYYMEGRDSMQLIYRWTKSLDPSLRKGLWAPEEDAKLLQAVAKYGEQDWFKIREEVPGRSDAQCRDRYLRRLHFSLKKGRWNSKEVKKLIELIEKYGVGHWAKIASELPHRSGSQCLSKWKIMVRQRQRARRRARWSPSSGSSSNSSWEDSEPEEAPKDVPEEAPAGGPEPPPAQYTVPDMDLWVPARQSTEELRGAVAGGCPRPPEGPDTAQATAPAPTGQLASRSRSADPRTVGCLCPATAHRWSSEGLLGKERLRQPHPPGSAPGLSPGGGSRDEARPRVQPQWARTVQRRQGHALQRRLLEHKLLTAVSPWVGEVDLLCARPRPAMRPRRADGIRRQLQGAHLASTPVFALLIQLFQIDVTGCMEVVRERKAWPPALLQAGAGDPLPLQEPSSAHSAPGTARLPLPLGGVCLDLFQALRSSASWRGSLNPTLGWPGWHEQSAFPSLPGAGAPSGPRRRAQPLLACPHAGRIGQRSRVLGGDRGGQGDGAGSPHVRVLEAQVIRAFPPGPPWMGQSMGVRGGLGCAGRSTALGPDAAPAAAPAPQALPWDTGPIARRASACLPSSPGCLTQSVPAQGAAKQSTCPEGGRGPQACCAASTPQAAAPAPCRPRPKPKTVSELLREKRLQEARARRAAQGPAVLSARVLVSTPMVLQPLAPPGASVSRVVLSGPGGPPVTSSSVSGSWAPVKNERAPTLHAFALSPATSRAPGQVPASCPLSALGQSQAPATSRKQGLPEAPPLLPAAPSPVQLPVQPLSLTPALGMPAAASTPLPVTWVLTAQGLLPVPLQAVVSLPPPTGAPDPTQLSVILPPSPTETPASRGPRLPEQSRPGPPAASTDLEPEPPCRTEPLSKSPTEVAEACGLAELTSHEEEALVSGETSAPRTPSQDTPLAHHPATGPPSSSPQPLHGAPGAASGPREPQPLDLEEPLLPWLGLENGPLDLSLLSQESEVATQEWLRGQQGVPVPALGSQLAYQPPTLCSLRALSGLLLRKKDLEHGAVVLAPGGPAGALQASLGLVRERLHDSPAYLLLRARFLAAFTLPALLATLSPRGVPTTLSASTGPDPETDSDDFDPEEPELTDSDGQPGDPAQGAPDPSQGSAPSCPDSPDNLDVLQTRRSRHVRKRRRLQ